MRGRKRTVPDRMRVGRSSPASKKELIRSRNIGDDRAQAEGEGEGRSGREVRPIFYADTHVCPGVSAANRVLASRRSASSSRVTKARARISSPIAPISSTDLAPFYLEHLELHPKTSPSLALASLRDRPRIEYELRGSRRSSRENHSRIVRRRKRKQSIGTVSWRNGMFMLFYNGLRRIEQTGFLNRDHFAVPVGSILEFVGKSEVIRFANSPLSNRLAPLALCSYAFLGGYLESRSFRGRIRGLKCVVECNDSVTGYFMPR